MCLLTSFVYLLALLHSSLDFQNTQGDLHFLSVIISNEIVMAAPAPHGSVSQVDPGFLQPPKAFSRYKATASVRRSCSFPPTTCTPRGKPSLLSPKGHWVTGKPSTLKIPVDRS